MQISNLQKKVYDNIFDTCDHSVASIKDMIYRVNIYNNKIKNGDKKNGSKVRES